MEGKCRGGSRTATTSKMERFVIIVNGWKISKTINYLPGGNLSELLVRNNHNDNLCSESELLLTNNNILFK